MVIFGYFLFMFDFLGLVFAWIEGVWGLRMDISVVLGVGSLIWVVDLGCKKEQIREEGTKG